MLLTYARNGFEEEVIKLLDNGAVVNARNRQSQTALYVASEQGHMKIVEILLSRGANVNLGAKPLIAAARCGFLHCVQLLLDKGALINATQSKGKTAFYEACEKRKYPVVDLLLSRGANPCTVPAGMDTPFAILANSTQFANYEHCVNILKNMFAKHASMLKDGNFEASCRLACQLGLREMTMRLVAKETNNNIQKYDGFALYYSAKNNWPEVLEKLLDRGLSVDSVMTSGGKTALAGACEGSQRHIIKMLLQKGADPDIGRRSGYNLDSELKTPLDIAASKGDVLILTMLLDNCTDVHTRNVSNIHSAMNAASKNGHTDVVRLLLQEGLEVRDSELDVACLNGHLEVVELLLKCGACVNHMLPLDDSQIVSTSSLHQAARQGFAKIVAVLLQAGADVGRLCFGKETPLHMACHNRTSQQSNPNAVQDYDLTTQLFVEMGSDVNVVNAMLETPLYLACANNYIETVKILLQFGADVGGVDDSDNKCPLRVACRNGYGDIVKLLLDHSASPYGLRRAPPTFDTVCALKIRGLTAYSNYTWHYMSPLCIAAEDGHHDIVDKLVQSGMDVNRFDDVLYKSALLLAINFLAGSNSNNIKELGRTPESRLASVRTLLEAGVDVNVMDESGKSPLVLALLHLKPSHLSKWRQRCKNYQFPGTSAVPLLVDEVAFKAHVDSCISLVKLLVLHGANIGDDSPDMDACTKSGYYGDGASLLRFLTPLSYPQEVIVHLLKAGAGVKRLAWTCKNTAGNARNDSTHLCKAMCIAGFPVYDSPIHPLHEILDTFIELLDVRRELSKFRTEERQEPPSLLRLSRVVIRHQLSEANNYHSILPAIDELLLPEQMRLYLRLEGNHTEVDLHVTSEGSTGPLPYDEDEDDEDDGLLSLPDSYEYYGSDNYSGSGYGYGGGVLDSDGSFYSWCEPYDNSDDEYYS